MANLSKTIAEEPHRASVLRDRRSIVFYTAIAACLALGLFLRAYSYFVNRSLWLDEASLALNLVNRPFLGLLRPLSNGQGAPVGFLFLTKAVIGLFGNRDYTLRLIPLLAGLASVPLMWRVSRQFGGRLFTIITLALFALSPRLIYYSSELKQYSTDVLIALTLLLLVPNCIREDAPPRRLAVLGGAGVLAIWFSHPSLFVFAGILLTLGVSFAVSGDRQRLLWLSGIGFAFVISLGLVYFVNLRQLVTNTDLLDFHSGSFAPLPPWSRPGWYYHALAGVFRDPARLQIGAISVGSLLIGVLSMASRRWQLALVLLAPFLLTLIASALRKYPFTGRLLLFTVPLLLLLLAKGVEEVRLSLVKGNKLAALVPATMAIYLLYAPTAAACRILHSPVRVEEIKPVMSHLREGYQDGDLVYVYYGAGAAFEYYAPQYGFDASGCMIGSWEERNDTLRLLKDVEDTRGRERVWFIFAHDYNWGVRDEQSFILEHIDSNGLKREEFKFTGASLYLYDMRGTP